MKQGQCSKVDSDCAQQSDSYFLPYKTEQKAIHSNIHNYCFLFSMSLLYLNSSSEEWYSSTEGRQEILRQMNIPL